MARQPTTICGQHFPTKTVLKAHTKRVRDTQPLGVPLSDEDREFVVEVFRTLYPNWPTKVMAGVQVTAVYVVHVEGARCFHMKLSDGGFAEPSLRVAFNPSLAKSKPTASDAFRYEAWRDCCKPYRDRYFQTYGNAEGMAPCELSGILIPPVRGECEVDHIPPNTFKKILADFLQVEHLRLEDVPTQEEPNGRITVLTEPLRTRWVAFHRSRAQLRVLAPSIHVGVTQAAALSGEDVTIGWLDEQFSVPMP
jgi:hypothetical protein